MGVKPVELIAFFLSLALATFIGYSILPGVVNDIKYSLYRSSSHSIALDINGLISLPAIATQNIIIDYQMDEKAVHKITIAGRIVTVTSVDDPKRQFVFSIPFDFTEKREMVEPNVRFSKLGGIFHIVGSK